MNDKADPTTTALVMEAYRAVESHSVYWRHDHPTADRLDRKAPDPGSTSLLDGSRQAVAEAQAMLKTAKEKLANYEAIAQRLMAGFRYEIRPYIAKALQDTYRLDVRRARAEILHWEEYVRYYRNQQQTAPAITGVVGEVVKGLR